MPGFLTSTSLSRFHSRSTAWRFRIRGGSTTPSFSRPASETSASPSPPTPGTLAPPFPFLAVLHTRGQNLHLHPHLHCVVPGGGFQAAQTAPAGSPAVRSLSSSPKRSQPSVPHTISARSGRLFAAVFSPSWASFAIWLAANSSRAPARSSRQTRMGRSRQASLRWTTTRAQVSGSLHLSRRHLQPPASRLWENGHVSFDWKDYADHSRNFKTMTLDGRVRSAASYPRAAPGLGPHPPLRLPRLNRVRKQKLIQSAARCSPLSQPMCSIDLDGSTTCALEDPHACPTCKRE